MRYNNRPQIEEPLRMSHVLEIIFRQKRVILISSLIILTIVATYTFIQKKVYEASTTIIIQDNQANVTLGLVNPDTKVDILQNEMEVLQSRDLLSKVTSKLIKRVYADPSKKEDTLQIIKNAKLMFGETDLNSAKIEEGIIREIKNSMDLTSKKGSNVVKFSYRSQNPVEAALIANLYVETYYERDLERSRSNSSELRSFLENQTQVKSKELTKSDSALQNYMQQNNVSELDLEANLTNNKVASIQSELEANDIEYQKTKLQLASYKQQLEKLAPHVTEKMVNSDDLYIKELQQIIAKKEAEKDVSKVISSNEAQRPEYAKQLNKNNRAIDSLRTLLANRTKSYLQNSLNNYSLESSNGDQNVNVISQLSGQIQQLQLRLSSLELSKNMLYDNLVKYSAKLNRLPKQSVTMAKLQRERAFNEKVAEKIGEKYQDAVLAEKSTFGQVEILDKASVPLEPVSPNIKMNLLLGLIGGVSFGLILAFVLNFMHNKIHTPKDLEHMGFRLLSTIPRLQLEPKNGKAKHMIGDANKVYSTALVSAKNPNSDIYESYLRLGINLAYNFIDKNFKSLLITSSGPGAGKSATAINVSITLANLGKSVLLVDTDIRRPVIHKYFNKAMMPGLTDYLLEQKEIYELIQPTLVKGLDVITCGGKLLNPSLILASERMKDLVEKETSNYDFIIYDAPPLNPVTDAIHLAKLVNEVILVVRAEKTNVEELKRANELLRQVNVEVSGVVLNDFDISKSPFSGKHYGYYSYSSEESSRKWKFGGKS
ncbi:MAG: polysaccharide biosynthesis tyrosine autokinase [Bacteroidota bacterium]|nr:polysaccharide biosynthesis tyrosine autokinase [Bacteroidota bacterium]MDP4191160.1 polysaccharide biosynthesis tyrosine autokinase [Bacteroidota bacterium]MDP4195033.1 polysaccharide biosynthesis tyrosine autokinase [Bacteroidota bacterium]